MELISVTIENPEELNFILGHSHFIKTVEDIHEAVVCTVPNAKFGVAFCEASGECLIRHSGTKRWWNLQTRTPRPCQPAIPLLFS